MSYVEVPHPAQVQRYAQSLWNLGLRDEALNRLMVDKFTNQINSRNFPGVTEKELKKVNSVLIRNKEAKPKLDFHRKFLDSLMTLDQSVRVGNDRYNPNYFSDMKDRDSLNRMLFLDFTRKHGAPGGLNVGWDQSVGAFFLHLPKEWIEENYELLMEEVKKGNIEPWCLARAIDRMWAEGEREDRISPNGFYHRETNEKPEIVFNNCVKIGASPYFNSPIHQLSEGKYFHYFHENKSLFSCVR